MKGEGVVNLLVRSIRSLTAAGCLAAAVLVGSSVIEPAPAQAVTIRPGAKDLQVDILLDSYETEKAAKSLWGATVICSTMGLPGWATILGPCQLYVTTCAAQAYTAKPRRMAGMTIAPYGFWCWKYG